MDSRNLTITGEDIYLQRLTGSGQVAPGWPPDGLPVCTAAGTQGIPEHGIVPDGFGGVLLVWGDRRHSGVDDFSADVYGQRIQASSEIAPGWQPDGNPVCHWPGFQGQEISIVPDGAGGAYVVWQDERDAIANPIQAEDGYAQHLTPDGQIAPGWQEGGIPLAPLPGFQTAGLSQTLISDGQGGAIAVWADCRSTPCETYGHRLLPGGLSPEWPTYGRLLVPGVIDSRMTGDGEGGFYLASTNYNEFGFSEDIYVNRFTFDGERAPGWPTEGPMICCPDGGFGHWPEVERDGMGGLYVVQSNSYGSGRHIYAYRVQGDGNLAPGWTFGGVQISNPAVDNNLFVDMVGDAAGGLYIVWEADDDTPGQKATLLHLSPDGAPIPGWPDHGVPVTSFRSQSTPKVTVDGSGGVIVVWHELGGTGSRRGLFTQRFMDDEEVSTRPSLVSAEAAESGIQLLWYAKDAHLLEASVYRRTESSSWTYIGAPEATGPDELQYDDVDVVPGERYAYRLGYSDGGTESFTDEVWVEAAAPLAFALDGFRPNPAIGLPLVSLTLAKSDPARLEIFDLRGRLVLRRDLSGLGAGRHSVPLDDQARLAPGVYVLRLTQGDRVARVRGVVLN
jgi:hypothetical protein